MKKILKKACGIRKEVVVLHPAKVGKFIEMLIRKGRRKGK